MSNVILTETEFNEDPFAAAGPRPCKVAADGKLVPVSPRDYSDWRAQTEDLFLLRTEVADGVVETLFKGQFGVHRCFWSYWVQGSKRSLLLPGEQQGHMLAFAEDQHDLAIQEALRDWFSAPSFPNTPSPSNIVSGRPLRGETIRSPLFVAAPSPEPEEELVDSPPRRMQSLRYRLMKRLSRGSANWYEIYDALTTDDARAVRTLELAWEQGLLVREEGTSKATPPSFALSLQGVTFLREGKLTMHDQRFANWKDDIWAPGWEPWRRYFCPLCGARVSRSITMKGNIQVYCSRGSREPEPCAGRWFLVLRHDRPAIEKFERGSVIIGIDHMRRKTHILIDGKLRTKMDRVLTRDEARVKLDLYTLFS